LVDKKQGVVGVLAIQKILFIFLTMVSALPGPAGATGYHTDVSGIIVDVFRGKMDPFVVGDVCITYIHSGEQDKIFGIIEDYDTCGITHFASRKIGKPFRISGSSIAGVLKTKKKIQVLESFRAQSGMKITLKKLPAVYFRSLNFYIGL
jgi:hypothetical protein